MANPVDLVKSKLSSKQRNDLPASAFVFPKDRSYPIPDESHAKNALSRASGKPEEAKVKAAVYRRYPKLKPSSDQKKAETVTVEKAADDLIVDPAQQIVYGVVLTPGVEDSQGDIITADEIEKAAHRWLVEYRKQDVQHSEIAKTDDGQPIAEPVESFCAPCDLELGDQQVLKGSWVLGCRVNDPATWEEVTTGKRTGFSIGGTGVREPLAA